MVRKIKVDMSKVLKLKHKLQDNSDCKNFGHIDEEDYLKCRYCNKRVECGKETASLLRALIGL